MQKTAWQLSTNVGECIINSILTFACIYKQFCYLTVINIDVKSKLICIWQKSKFKSCISQNAFFYGGEDISRTVASVCMVFSGKVDYTIMHIMTCAFVLHSSKKGNIFIFVHQIYSKFGCFLINFTGKQRLGILVNPHVIICILV